MQRIATASHEQMLPIDEVNIAVRQMDEITQYIAARLEEANAGIEQIDNQMDQLDWIVGNFKNRERLAMEIG